MGVRVFRIEVLDLGFDIVTLMCDFRFEVDLE